jgi:hypothetical protein
MSKLVVVLVWIYASAAMALVPVEGILMGEAKESIQQDPLKSIFSDIYDRSVMGENKKLKLYHNTYRHGAALQESCQHFSPPIYPSVWQEKQARRSMAATLQYIGLDTSIKSIGAYAKRIDIDEKSFEKLVKNIVTNYCSSNVTVFARTTIEKSLYHYYKNPEFHLIPTIESSPFVTDAFKYRTEAPEMRAAEFEYAVRAFRSFCSWGGEVEDYRMLTPYLSNRFIMAFTIRNMLGLRDHFNEREQKVETIVDTNTVQVNCNELICRRTTAPDLMVKLPRSAGSTGLGTDLAKLYCHHFRFQDLGAGTSSPQVKKWIKDSELEDPIFETNFFLSVMTGVPDPVFGSYSYQDLPFVAKSSIDDRWSRWSKNVLSTFSSDLLFEESLKIKARPRREFAALASEGFLLDFFVTLGEMDRLMDEKDKISLSFDLKFSKNYLRSLIVRWNELSTNLDEEGKARFRKDMARYIEHQLKTKEKMFSQKMWNQDFPRLIADELLEQVLSYRGSLFTSYQEQMLRVPVKFSYGLFALSYLRYRADLKADRIKINL